MEKTVHPEQELEKHDESNTETPETQQEETVEQKSEIAADDSVKKLQDELAEAKDKYVRLYAEFDNYRRRTAKEKLEMVQSANEQLIRSLLSVMDDFERAEKSFKDKNDKEAEGFFLIHSKFRKVFDQFNVKPMEAGKGTDFNPDWHEAITQIPAPEENLKGKIVDVVEQGYVIGEKVIRFAKVVVGS